MSQNIIVGPVSKGLTTTVLPFNIDDDAFPYLINAYVWRGRVKRKRGTALLGQLNRFFNSASTAYSATATITLDGAGNGNVLTGFSLQSTASIIPGSVTITSSVPILYTDPAENGALSPSGSINYSTGAIVIAAAAGLAVSAQFKYNPGLPVMGLEDLIVSNNAFPGTLAFDTTYSYRISTSNPYPIYDVSFYNNPASGTYAGYVQKSVWTPTDWNGADYQQIWSTDYQNAFWATNGIDVPFTGNTIGMQFKPIVAVTVTAGGPPAICNLQITGHGLVVGDFLFINEVLTTTGINFQTGYVTVVVDANNVTVEFPNATIATNGTLGIAQYLTNRSDPTKDCLRWYNGDPTTAALPPTFNTNNGWVNFMPPLSSAPYSIADEAEVQYYLVGARMIFPFKDRLLFFGPVIQSSTGAPIFLQDTVIYSQNGTAYYTCSYTNLPNPAKDTPTSIQNVLFPILLPAQQTATPSAYFENEIGFGGFITVGIDQPINTVSTNEDALILGFSTNQIRMIYTGNDVVPFNFFIVNAELGSTSTFSSINMDRGIISRGSRGFIISSQTEAKRIDLPILDQVFQINLLNNGTERVCAQRDFINEWIYFTYPSNEVSYKYPNQTLQYNYREESWALFNECYTTYGTFRQQTGQTWATLDPTLTWESWNTPWDSGSSTLLQPLIIAGNQQGFVVLRDQDTDEGASLFIQNIVGTTVTSTNHCLNTGDYIVITGCIGVTGVNGNIYSVNIIDNNSFSILNVPATIAVGTYLGGGLIQRMYVPYIQTKQFHPAWGAARKTRIGVQQYLLSRTNNGQITLLIFLNENVNSPYNEGPVVPSPNAVNDSLVYETILYTCPESTNLGLTPANVNLQMPTASQQQQIWHRQNTSLIGDTVQLGFTMSDAQMRDVTFSNQFVEIELHGFIIATSASQLLS